MKKVKKLFGAEVVDLSEATSSTIDELRQVILALGIRELKKRAKIRPGRQLGKVSRKRG